MKIAEASPLLNLVENKDDAALLTALALLKIWLAHEKKRDNPLKAVNDICLGFGDEEFLQTVHSYVNTLALNGYLTGQYTE